MAKVLHIYKTYMPFTMGGVEQVIQQLAISTQSAGFDHQVLTLHEGEGLQFIQRPEAEVIGIPYRFQALSTPLSIAYIRHVRRLAEHADILHFHHPFPLQDVAQSISDLGKPSIVTYHSDVVRQKWANRLYLPLLSRFLNKANTIVAASPQYQNSSKVLQRYKQKTQVIPFGLAEESYPSPSAERLAHWRAQFDQGFFLFVGVLRYYKGLDTLIQAARDSGLPVVVAGDGPLRKDVEAAAANLDHFHYLGMVSDEDKMALLSLATAFVFPSSHRSEAFGISLLEAAMAGKAMVSTEIGTGTSFINIAGETGLVVPPSDAKSLSAAMTTLWRDEPLRTQLGERARARFLSVFTSSEMGRCYAEAYRGLLAASNESALRQLDP
jgi:rhamnosyl/mannosyltransferase